MTSETYRTVQPSFFIVKFGKAIDAIRVADGAKVVIKEVSTDSDELSLLLLLNSKDMRTDHRNRIVNVVDVLLAPDTDEKVLVVMPRLIQFATVPFQFLDEVFDAFSQLLEVRAVFGNAKLQAYLSIYSAWSFCTITASLMGTA